MFNNNSATGFYKSSNYGELFKSATKACLGLELAPYDVRYMMGQHVAGADEAVIESRAHRMGTSSRALKRSYSSVPSVQKGWLANHLSEYDTQPYNSDMQTILVPDHQGALMPARILREGTDLVCAMMKPLESSVSGADLWTMTNRLYVIKGTLNRMSSNEKQTRDKCPKVDGQAPLFWDIYVSMTFDVERGAWLSRNLDAARNLFLQKNSPVLDHMERIGQVGLGMGTAVAGPVSGDLAYDKSKAVLISVISSDDRSAFTVMPAHRCKASTSMCCMHRSYFSFNAGTAPYRMSLDDIHRYVQWPIDVHFDTNAATFTLHSMVDDQLLPIV